MLVPLPEDALPHLPTKRIKGVAPSAYWPSQTDIVLQAYLPILTERKEKVENTKIKFLELKNSNFCRDYSHMYS
jgi:hypothetical protein